MNDKTKTEGGEQDALSQRLDAIETDLKGTIESQNETIKEQAEAIAELKNRPSNDSDDDDAILVDRQSAHTMRMPVVNGVPVIKGKSERVVGIEGIDYLMKVETADGEKYSFPIGCDISKLNFSDSKLKGIESVSYENIQTKDFKLQDIDTNDLTGASKVEKGEIVSEGNKIPEIDRSSGNPIMTGRKIRTVVRNDVRYYTIEHDGEKFTIDNEMLGNIRV